MKNEYPSNTSLTFNTFLYSILALALIWQFSEILKGWDHVILPHHGWRQSQTAIAAYYFLKDGFSFYTTIPVFGPPWILPLEFPLYQWILAAVVGITDFPIDQSGRGISLFFHYASLFAIYKILRFIEIPKAGIIITLILLTLSPLATYWAQGVLIESLSVFLTLTFVYFCLSAFRDHQRKNFILACVLGSLAAVVKVTTFSVGWGFIVLYAVYQLFENRTELKQHLQFRNGHFLLPLIIPLICVVAWIIHANSVISKLPIGTNVLGGITWYFGELNARFDPSQIGQVQRHAISQTLGYSVTIVFCGLALIGRQTKKEYLIIFLLTAISGPLVFWNVYYVHDYYAYEIVFFLCASIGIAIAEIIPFLKSYSRPLPYILILFLTTATLVEYYDSAYAWLFRHNHRADLQSFGEHIKDSVDENEFVYIAGYAWDPVLAYTSKRKTVMSPFNEMIETLDFWNKFDSIVENGQICGGVVLKSENLSPHQIKIIRNRFKLPENPDFSLNEELLFFDLK